MHIEIQVALNFVISYLYNKLPRRRVNIFGEELEKALRDKFQGHWYPEKPFKGSAYRCLKTGDPIDSVLARAARESGVPISDVLENLPNELSVWVDPGEVSYRIGEKGAVKILYTENNENHEDSHSADREVTKTFNPEAQCFRPIDAVNTTMNNLSLSPKALPLPLPLPPTGSSPHSAASSSPTYNNKGSPNPNGGGSSGVSLNGTTNNAPAAATAAAFVQRAAQAPLTFTTATFAQTKFGSTKLKTSSKRTNSSYRMSPTEFSNYIKQRAMQQQLHHGHGVTGNNAAAAAFGALDAVSPARSLSPNPLALGGNQANQNAATDPFYYPNITMGLYPQYNGQRNLYEPSHYNADAGNLGLFGGGGNNGSAAGGSNGYNAYLEPCYFANGHATAAVVQQQQQQQQQQSQQQQQQQQQSQQQQQQQQSLSVNNLEHANSSESCFGLDTDSASGIEDMATVGGINTVNVATAVTGIESSSDSNSPISTPTAAGVVPSLNTVAAAAAASAAAAAAAAAAVAAPAVSSATNITTTNNVATNTAAGGVVANTQTQENSATGTATTNNNSNNSSNNNNTNNANNNNNNKLIDGLSSFYGTGSSYQQLLVAN